MTDPAPLPPPPSAPGWNPPPPPTWPPPGGVAWAPPPPPPPGGPAWAPPPPPGGPGWGPPPSPWGPVPQGPWIPPPPPSRSHAALIIGLSLAAVAVLIAGVTLVGIGRRVSHAAERPRAGLDHWHTAYGLFLCDHFLQPIRSSGDQNGIHTHGDGVVHVEALGPSSSGSNAIFRRFEEAEGLRITSSAVRWVDGTVPLEASTADGCRSQAAEVMSFVDGRLVKGDPGRIRLRNGQVIVIALVPKGTSYAQIGNPVSARYLPELMGP